ncbi:putative toxin-antitoxin system toxin component, PIN family [Nostoc sp. UIC 10607]|uniref:putative toxin-antitoxin system toxin component, PIN family n=1 Tax=Nostoc sp. UIC 10607 TaxID=3045935 RepID=UPI0039A070AE
MGNGIFLKPKKAFVVTKLDDVAGCLKYQGKPKALSQINTCRDPDENNFLELAKDANAEFLITGDQYLLSLKTLAEYQNQIITPRDFIDLD